MTVCAAHACVCVLFLCLLLSAARFVWCACASERVCVRVCCLRDRDRARIFIICEHVRSFVLGLGLVPLSGGARIRPVVVRRSECMCGTVAMLVGLAYANEIDVYQIHAYIFLLLIGETIDAVE